MRDDTTLVEDAAAALHVALHRAEAWARLAAARGVLLGEASVALAALATFEGSYTYGDPQTIQAANSAAQVWPSPCTAQRAGLMWGPVFMQGFSTARSNRAVPGSRVSVLGKLSLQNQLIQGALHAPGFVVYKQPTPP